MSSLILGVVGMVGAWWLARYVVRLRRQRAVNRVIRQSLSEYEQRRKAWAIVEGDGIRPPRSRF